MTNQKGNGNGNGNRNGTGKGTGGSWRSLSGDLSGDGFSQEFVDGVGVETCDSFSEEACEQEYGQEQERDGSYGLACVDEPGEEGEDDEDVGEVDLVASLAEG